MKKTPEEITATAQALTESILRSLGFEFTLEASLTDAGEILIMISGQDASYIIGEGGSRLDDLQYLLNRLIVQGDEDVPRVRVDCNHYRERSEAKLVQMARKKAERVLANGKPFALPPMNAYHRRMVHSALAEIPGIKTESEDVDSRFKRITISRV